MTVTIGEYTTRLGAGLGMIEESEQLLAVWERDMTPSELCEKALNLPLFPSMSARRIRNVVIECFAPRYLSNAGLPAKFMKELNERVSAAVRNQFHFVFTCRANPVLSDFVTDVYWETYASGQTRISNQQALEFVTLATAEGRTTTGWSDSIKRRVASYLTGCLADFGLLQPGARRVRTILPFRIQSQTAAVLAYQLHFEGLPDNRVVADPSWSWFGLERADVMFELQRWAKKNLFLIQSAGNVTRIDWRLKSMNEVLNVID